MEWDCSIDLEVLWITDSAESIITRSQEIWLKWWDWELIESTANLSSLFVAQIRILATNICSKLAVSIGFQAPEYLTSYASSGGCLSEPQIHTSLWPCTWHNVFIISITTMLLTHRWRSLAGLLSYLGLMSFLELMSGPPFHAGEGKYLC